MKSSFCLSEFGRYSTSAPNGMIGPLKDSPNFVHTKFSRLPGGLGHFADSNSIPQNLTITFHPIQIAIKLLMFLLLLVVHLVLQFRLFLNDAVWLFDDSMVILHKICQILMNCSYK